MKVVAINKLVPIEQPQQTYIAQVAVTPEQALYAYQALQEITKKVLKEGTDYDKIPGTPKPSLLKPGAENLLRFYGLGHEVCLTEQVKDWESGFFYFSYKVTVFKTLENGIKHVLSECEGSANSKEKRYRNQDVFTLVNTLQKMAIKRALVGATLQATGASGLFTQDVEDMDLGQRNGSREAAQNAGQERLRQEQERAAQRQQQTMTGQISEAQQKAIFSIGKSKGLSNDEVKAIVRGETGAESVAELSKQQASEMIKFLQDTDKDTLKEVALAYMEAGAAHEILEGAKQIDLEQDELPV
jgi:hypothetical protein